jgi:NitT/TauT family transport system ATP-binding protein
MTQPVQIRGVSKIFDIGTVPVQALKDINLEIEAEEFVAIVGASGCGKSTMLRLVGGLGAPTSGEIQIGGKVISGPGPGIGIVFQTPVLLPWRSVEQNVQLPLDIQGLGKRRARVQELLDLAGLRGFERSSWSRLMGGVNAIRRLDGLLMGGADPRRSSYAIAR